MRYKGLRGCAAAALALALAIVLAACNSQSPQGAGTGKLQVVASENFWGSLARQLGGNKVEVQSIITNPATDPHSYEPSAGDARSLSDSQMALVNGIGYDEWASHLLGADSGSRVVLNVGKLLGLGEGANPHQWYSPANVHAVIAQITADYDKLRPADASYFAQQRQRLEWVGLARYEQLIAQIRSRYAGVPVGYSESIFQPLGEALALKLTTPYSFAKAIAEGTDVTAQDKQTVNHQAETHQIKVWIFNSQNVTPEVQRVNQLVHAAHIPITTVTETLSPASASFQQWQTTELERLQHALHQATGR
jgi:zinc/manganese transport system substrate-binding protein